MAPVGEVNRLTSENTYSCAGCRTHGAPLIPTPSALVITPISALPPALSVATHEQLVSKSFQGRHGRAFLFTTATNVLLGPKEERVLMTGSAAPTTAMPAAPAPAPPWHAFSSPYSGNGRLHSVCDIYCTACSSRLGWKYLEAFEHSQKYKEGKFIVEKCRVVEGEAL